MKKQVANPERDVNTEAGWPRPFDASADEAEASSETAVCAGDVLDRAVIGLTGASLKSFSWPSRRQI